MTRLQTRSLTWLCNQRAPYVRGYNGKEYDAAIDALIERRLDENKDEDHLIARRAWHPLPIQNDEEDGIVEIVDYGGKGGRMRIVHSSTATVTS